MHYRHIFGPVPSRRLGMSLGLDMVVHKTCSMNCIYCECGKTTHLTLKRKEYVPFKDIKAELAHFLGNNSDPDYITFGGSGEPTLNPCMGKLIDYIRSIRPHVRIAVLTNSSLINDPDVKNDLLKADLILPSLDAVTDKAFRRINRPHPKLEIKNIVKGLENFAREFTGEIWLEVLILPEINDDRENLMALKEAVHKILPTKLQLNTLDRPGTVSNIKPASAKELEQAAQIINYPDTEIIAKITDSSQYTLRQDDFDTAIIDTIQRRPCTVKDLSKILGSDEALLDRCLKALVREGKILSKAEERGLFYKI